MTFAEALFMPGIVLPTGAPIYVGSHIVKFLPFNETWSPPTGSEKQTADAICPG